MPRLDGSSTRRRVRLLSRLALFGLAVVFTQAVLRRPVAQLLGGDHSSVIEAAVAAVALALVFALLIWAYETARPMVQAMTLRAIDAAIPTVGVPPVAEPMRTMSPAAAEPTVRAPVARDPEATVRAPALQDSQATVRSVDPDATVPSPHRQNA